MTHPLTNTVTEESIASYLASSPDFFERHAQLLASVLLTSPHGNRAVSLQERQAEMLREKIKALEHRIMDMIRNANDNGVLSDKLLRWARTLFLVEDAATLPERMAGEIRRQFGVPQVAIKLWDVAPVYATAPFAVGASEDARLFAGSLTEPFCGLNTGFEAALWLDDPQAAASLALLPLRAAAPDDAGTVFGLLVLASPDAQRFSSAAGTNFLERMADLAGAALSRLRQPRARAS